MVTLLTVHSSDGLTGRCDARCYNAKGPVCTCCCGGVNHGKGREQATENMRTLAGEIMHGIEGHAEVPAQIDQLELAGM